MTVTRPERLNGAWGRSQEAPGPQASSILYFWCGCENVSRQILQELFQNQWGVLFKGIVEGFLRAVWAGFGWGGGGGVMVELGINQRSKNRLPGTRTSAIPDKSKRIFSRTTHHCGEYIYFSLRNVAWIFRSKYLHSGQIMVLFNYANKFL